MGDARMKGLRQTAKHFAQLMGVYPWIRDTKSSLYWKIENWQWPLLMQLQSILGISAAQARSLSQEFDATGIWQNVNAQIARETLENPNYFHGTSSEQDLRALYILTRVLKPETVIETGVASGASAATFLRAFKENARGRLYSIDLSPTAWSALLPAYRERDRVTVPPAKAVGWLIPQDLRAAWNLNVGDSRDVLPKLLKELEACDLFYHDAEHTYEAMRWEYETVWPYLTAGAVLASDDVHWSKAFDEFAKRTPDVQKAYSWRGFGMMKKRK